MDKTATDASELWGKLEERGDKSGVPYQLTPMGTLLEGAWEDVMGVVTACFKTLQADCPRIGMNLKVEYRAGPQSRLRRKVAKVEGQLGRKPRT